MHILYWSKIILAQGFGQGSLLKILFLRNFCGKDLSMRLLSYLFVGVVIVFFAITKDLAFLPVLYVALEASKRKIMRRIIHFFKIRRLLFQLLRNKIMVCSLLTFFAMMANPVMAQLTAPSASFVGSTLYTTTPGSDLIFVFCSSKENPGNGRLEAVSPMGNPSVYIWERYNESLAAFEQISVTDTLETSSISNLRNGLYRVTISDQSTTSEYQAWVLNDWIDAKADIPDSSSVCEYFKIVADFTSASLEYYDPTSNEKIDFRLQHPEFKTVWTVKGEIESVVLNAVVYDPPAKNTKYTLTITDDLGCETVETIEYISKTTEASFTCDPLTGEAVLQVEFTNNSLNYDSTYWYFYRELDQIKKDIENAEGEIVDSIDFVLMDPSPIYEFEWSGYYKVRLMTVKVNDTGNCYSTYYIPENIVVDTSFVDVSNAFSPNGDNVNELFMVKTISLKSINIQIFNRWGGLVHSYKNTNLRSSSTVNQFAVWDGKVGGRMASPGVYYYVVKAVGRDDKKLQKHGFFHLLR